MRSPSTQLPKGTTRMPLHPGRRGAAAADSGSALPPCRSPTQCSAPGIPSQVRRTPFQIHVWAALPPGSAKANGNKYTDI